jgi:hypothetical protein
VSGGIALDERRIEPSERVPVAAGRSTRPTPPAKRTSPEKSAPST